MAENKPKKQSNPLVGSQAQPTTLDNTTTLDIDVKKTLADNIIEAGLSSQLDIAKLENFTSISNSRDQIYQLIDTMAQDASVAAILKTYAENVCEPSDNGHVIWCESNDPSISKFINYILNTMNADKNMYSWAYSLVKYGDVYLKLFRESDYKDDLFKAEKVDLANTSRSRLTEEYDESKKLEEAVKLHINSDYDPYSYYVEQIDDPGTMFELTKFGKTYGYIEVPNEDNNIDATSTVSGMAMSGTYNFRMKSADVHVWQADDFVHACLEDNFTRYPETVELFLNEDNSKSHAYRVRRGKSLLYDNYKVWREKSLLENAALLNRITRSSIVRKVGVEVGDMPKEQVQATLRRVKEMMEQKGAINVGNSMSEYNNPGPIENNIYFATHGGQGNISIEAVGGDVDVKNLADLDFWNNKFYSAYGVPKQYYGWCLGADTKITLLNGSTYTIKELFDDKEKFIGKGILGCNQDGSLCPTKISNIMLTNPKAKLMRIWLDNGEYVDVTPDHRMMLRDGTFVRADELKENDSLMPYYHKFKDGYRYVLDNKLGGWVPQYHIVAAKKGEAPEIGYNIHHKNRKKVDDDFDNLTKISIEDHCLEHNRDLSRANKKANQARRVSDVAVNANVGSRYITNGLWYQTLKAGEELPEGFWYEGPKKSEATKRKMSAARMATLEKHPEYAYLGGFKKGEASDEVIAKMKAGQAAYLASLTPEELEARKEISRRCGKANVKNMNDARLAKLEAAKPGILRKERSLRCPHCGQIFTKKLNDFEYDDYLQMNKLHFCCKEHRSEMDAGGKLARSYKLYLSSSHDAEAYEANRWNGGSRPDTFLMYNTLQKHLELLEAYVPEVNHRVVKIEYLEDTHPVYDITVEDDCHTFALSCGIFVHNCEDAAGFNGGTSLAILSSEFSKAVKRVQNSLIQMLTDAVNLFLLNKGCKSFLNNFTLKMKTPVTQEEIDYRNEFTNKINAISSLQSLFTDVEDKPRRLRILKALIASLNYGDEINAEIDAEIAAAEEAAKKAEEEAELEGTEEESADIAVEKPEAPASEDTDTEDIDLGTLDALELESFGNHEGELLMEDNDLNLDATMILTEDDLPSPEELDKEKDFSENI